MEYLFEGNISVKAAILAGYRPITKVLADSTKIDRDTSFILAKAYERNIEVIKCDRQTIDEVAMGNSHGGLIAYGEERQYQTVDDLRGKNFLALLEGIEDPFNFAYCLRSLYAAGCEGVIVNKRNWFSEASVIAKSSAGASEYLAVVATENPDQRIKELKPEYRVVAADRKDAIPLYQANLKDPLILCIGGEKRGLSRKVMNQVDQNIYIPYDSEFRNALNACSAVSVAAFEILRQRNYKDENIL